MKLTPALIVLLFTVSVFIDAGASGFLSSGEDADYGYVKASLYEQDGNYEEASRLLEAVLESADDEYVYIKLAEIYNKLQDMEMVKFTLERGVRKLPDSYTLTGALADVYRKDDKTVEKSFDLFERAYKMSGNPVYAEAEARAHAQKNDYNSAISIYDALIKKDPKSDYYVQRAKNLEKLGLEDEAVKDYIKASSMDGNFMASARLADYYMDKGEDEKAIIYLKNVIELSPDMTLAKFRLAVLLGKLGKSEEAEGYFLSIVDVLNENERVYVYKQMAKMAMDKKDYEKAEKYFTNAYEINSDIQTAYSLAVIAETTSEFDVAKSWYEEILKNRPDFVEARKRLAIIDLREGNAEKALEIISGVEDIYKDVNYYRISAQAYTDMKDYKSAEKILTEAIQLNPAEVKLYIDLALSLDRQGDKKRAEKVIKDGMKYFPDDPALLNFLGYMYVEKGIKLDEAKDMISRALKQKPEEPAYLDSMGWVLYQLGMYEEAFEYQKKALEAAPDEQEMRDHMKAILEKLGLKKDVDDFIKAD